MQRTDEIIYLAARLRDRAYTFITEELERMNVEGAPSHGAILVALLRHQPLSLTELSQIIDKKKSSTTELVDKLIRLGYVEKTTDEHDQRIKLIRLTEKSLALKSRFAELTEKLMAKTYRGLSVEEQHQFVNLLAKIVNNF
jgi:MarR family transcriptional regulator, organic hydroperoxide resistance regulator